MARLPRLNLPDIPQHVVQRGNNRQVCFFAEQDYCVYLQINNSDPIDFSFKMMNIKGVVQKIVLKVLS
jgi:hypothetical protein